MFTCVERFARVEGTGLEVRASAYVCAVGKLSLEKRLDSVSEVTLHSSRNFIRKYFQTSRAASLSLKMCCL